MNAEMSTETLITKLPEISSHYRKMKEPDAAIKAILYFHEHYPYESKSIASFTSLAAAYIDVRDYDLAHDALIRADAYVQGKRPQQLQEVWDKYNHVMRRRQMEKNAEELLQTSTMTEELADLLKKIEEGPEEEKADYIKAVLPRITAICRKLARPEEAMKIAEGFYEEYADVMSGKLLVSLGATCMDLGDKNSAYNLLKHAEEFDDTSPEYIEEAWGRYRKKYE